MPLKKARHRLGFVADQTASATRRFDMVRSSVLSLCLLLIIGCDIPDRVSRLEKENADLKAQIEKDHTARDYDLQAKCSKDARAWFKEGWDRDKDTILLDFTNHYNRASNSCFIRVEYHHYSNTFSKTITEWNNDISLWNVYENDQIGEFLETHTLDFSGGGSKSTDKVLTCAVNGKKCSSLDELVAMTNPYMSN